MCVIAYKPMNVPFMGRATLKECFKNNPDGAGFMFPHGGKVHIRKGFMDFNDFWSALKATRSRYGDDIPYVMHFRISTQAGVNQHCCHPYPLSASMDTLRKLSCSADVGIAHNGVIHLTSDGAKDYNDTMKFITDYATLLIKKVDWWRNPNVATALEALCGSKLAILGADSHVELIGRFKEHNGCWYSNESFYRPKKPKNPCLGVWEEDWKRFLKDGVYYFEEDYCPFVVDNDMSYCDSCLHFEDCPCAKTYYEYFWNGPFVTNF